MCAGVFSHTNMHPSSHGIPGPFPHFNMFCFKGMQCRGRAEVWVCLLNLRLGCQRLPVGNNIKHSFETPSWSPYISPFFLWRRSFTGLGLPGWLLFLHVMLGVFYCCLRNIFPLHLVFENHEADRWCRGELHVSDAFWLSFKSFKASFMLRRRCSRGSS